MTTNGIAKHWRLRAQRYRLIGSRCSACQTAIFPPRVVCPHCIETDQWQTPWSDLDEQALDLDSPIVSRAGMTIKNDPMLSFEPECEYIY